MFKKQKNRVFIKNVVMSCLPSTVWRRRESQDGHWLTQSDAGVDSWVPGVGDTNFRHPRVACLRRRTETYHHQSSVQPVHQTRYLLPG